MRRWTGRWAAIGIAVLASAFPSTGAGATTPVPLGVFLASGGPAAVGEYEQWAGRQVRWVLDYVGRMPDGSATPWAKIDDPSWWCSRWSGSGYSAVLSVAVLPTFAQTLEQGAAGAYDAHWRRFAETLVAGGCGDLVLRLGWEFNGTFFPWAAGGRESAYAAYWRRIVDTVRSVPGTAFRFEWTPLRGNRHADVEAAYPGDAYVDIVGLDAYDVAPETYAGRSAERWTWQRTTTYGLEWHRAFAAAHGKPMAFSEWGLTVRPKDGLGGGDNPYFIQKMFEWIAANDVAYAIYFEADADNGVHRLQTGRFPLSALAFRTLSAGGGELTPLRSAPTPSATPGARPAVVAVDRTGELSAAGGSARQGPRWPWPVVRDVAVTGAGGWVLDAYGALHPFGGAPRPAVSGYWRGWDVARAVAAHADGRTGYVLDAFGGLHPFGGAAPVRPSGYWPGRPVAVDVTLLPGSTATAPAGYVLDAFGGLHRFGGAPPVRPTAYWPGWSVARAVAAAPGGGGWVLDAFGGLHPFGDAPAVRVSGYWPGWDIARDVVVSGAGAGYVLDGFGGLHPFGGAAPVRPSVYWGRDVAIAAA